MRFLETDQNHGDAQTIHWYELGCSVWGVVTRDQGAGIEPRLLDSDGTPEHDPIQCIGSEQWQEMRADAEARS